MAYRGLGSRFVEAVTTYSGNSGNWTAVFSPSVMGIHVSFFEIYRASFTGGPSGSTVRMYVNNDLISVSPAGQGAANAWNPPVPHELTPGDSVYFMWDKGTGSAPTANAFFRYDTFANVI